MAAEVGPRNTAASSPTTKPERQRRPQSRDDRDAGDDAPRARARGSERWSHRGRDAPETAQTTQPKRPAASRTLANRCLAPRPPSAASEPAIGRSYRVLQRKTAMGEKVQPPRTTCVLSFRVFCTDAASRRDSSKLHLRRDFAQLRVVYPCNFRWLGSNKQRLARPFLCMRYLKTSEAAALLNVSPIYAARVGAPVRLPQAAAISWQAPTLHAWRSRRFARCTSGRAFESRRLFHARARGWRLIPNSLVARAGVF